MNPIRIIVRAFEIGYNFICIMVCDVAIKDLKTDYEKTRVKILRDWRIIMRYSMAGIDFRKTFRYMEIVIMVFVMLVMNGCGKSKRKQDPVNSMTEGQSVTEVQTFKMGAVYNRSGNCDAV